jgi:CRISPR-associated endonuclease Cas1
MPSNDYTHRLLAYKRSEEYCQKQLQQFMNNDKETIVMGGYGEKLTVENGNLYVYRELEEPIILQAGAHAIKEIIYILSIGKPTKNVLEWIHREKIILMVFNKYGEIILFSSPSAVSDKELLLRQATLPEEGKIAYGRHILRQRLLEQSATLRKYQHMLQNVEEKAAELDDMAYWIAFSGNEDLRSRDTLMLKKKQAGETYFECWKQMEIQWQDKDLVPTHWRIYDTNYDAGQFSPGNANHPVNALLTFVYGILAVRVKLACIARGLDVHLSFLYKLQNDREHLVYDLMEPMKAHMEDLVLSYLKNHSFLNEDFGEEHTFHGEKRVL